MLKYMDYIYAVYQERSITKAAKKLYISQPWLSSIVKKVEDELQAPIFRRASGMLTLTEAGEFYIRRIEQIIRVRDEMNAYFYGQKTASVTTIHIGSGSIFCIYILPKLLKKFCEDHPNIQIIFHEGANAEMIEKLLNHQVDLYIESNPPENDNLKTVLWSKEELVLAVPTSYPLNKALRSCAYTVEEYRQRDSIPAKPYIPLTVMRDVPFVSAAPGNDSYRRSMEICEECGFQPDVKFFVSSQFTSYFMACQGIGATFTRSIIPDFLPMTEKVLLYRIDSALARRNIYLSYDPSRMSKAMQEVILTIQDSELPAFMESQ